MYIHYKFAGIFMLILSTGMLRAETAENLDPVAISPEYYQVRFENEYVRVVEYEILPGQKEKWHTHPAKLGYVVSGGTLKITTENGDSFVVTEAQGEVRWMGAVGRHFGENVGDTPIRILLVEVKGADDAKTDMDEYLQEETSSAVILPRYPG